MRDSSENGPPAFTLPLEGGGVGGGDSSEQGLTLIELLVALGLFSIVSLAAFSVLSSSQQAAVMNDQTVQVQQNVRLAMDLVSRDIRMAGFGNPPAGSVAGCANHINATDNNTAGADTGSDTISVVTVDQEIGTLASGFSNGNVITLNTLPSDIAVGQVVTLEGIFTAGVSAFNTGTKQLTLVEPGTATPKNILSPVVFAAGTQVIRLACVSYTVTGSTVTPPFQLLRNNVALVDGIESLQLAYAVDADNEGTIDDQNANNAFDCLDFVPNNTACMQGTTLLAAGTVKTIPSSVNTTPTSARQIRITGVGRAIPPAAANVANNTWKDPTYKSSSAVNVEDQAIANADGIRRRTLTRVVSLRDASVL